MILFLFLKDHLGLEGARVELRRPEGWMGVSLSRQLVMIT